MGQDCSFFLISGVFHSITETDCEGEGIVFLMKKNCVTRIRAFAFKVTNYRKAESTLNIQKRYSINIC